MENILNSVGQGDCLACICDVIPALCQGNNIIIPQTRSELEDKDQEEKDSQTSCNFLACAGSIIGELDNLSLDILLEIFCSRGSGDLS